MSTAGLQARVRAVGLVAPGIADWQEGAAVLAGRKSWQNAPIAIPATDLLPPAERRRAGRAIRLALGCAHQALVASGCDAGGVASVFASTDVDAENTHQICLALNEAEPALSPTRFHNSVQNAVSGYWTIVTGARAPTTMVMGGDGIFAIGLLEAMAQAGQATGPVLLVVFDLPMPEPLFSTHPSEGGGAIALVLDAQATQGPLLTASLSGAAAPGDLPAALHALRRTHPVGPALQLLRLLAVHESAGRSSHDADGEGAGEQTRLELDRYHSLLVTVQRTNAT